MNTTSFRSIESLPDIIEPADAAEVMHVSTKTIYRLIRCGRLRACRIGRRYRIRKSWLLDLIEAAN